MESFVPSFSDSCAGVPGSWTLQGSAACSQSRSLLALLKLTARGVCALVPLSLGWALCYFLDNSASLWSSWPGGNPSEFPLGPPPGSPPWWSALSLPRTLIPPDMVPWTLLSKLCHVRSACPQCFLLSGCFRRSGPTMCVCARALCSVHSMCVECVICAHVWCVYV